MNRTALTTIAPEIFRKRLLVEGTFGIDVTEDTIREFFKDITRGLGLRTYGDPIVYRTKGEGQHVNEGFDAFVPLIESGIYIGVWLNPRFLSTIIYSCGPFNEDTATTLVRDFFQLREHQAAVF